MYRQKSLERCGVCFAEQRVRYAVFRRHVEMSAGSYNGRGREAPCTMGPVHGSNSDGRRRLSLQVTSRSAISLFIVCEGFRAILDAYQ
jgi:hypothetical protein